MIKLILRFTIIIYIERNKTMNTINFESLNNLEILDRDDLIKIIKTMATGGVAVMFNGKRSAMEIQKKVRPRAVRTRKELSFGDEKSKSENIILEGENLQAMVTLYKYRNEIDLIVTDPPYNTGRSFRYNDKWDEDPNDPELGNVVPLEDGSRHTKWMKAMLPRLQMMRAMLKPSGVLAICIDDSELYHLGMMLDEVFGEQNRIGIINWQKTYSPKNDSTHVSTSTEYVLVYAKDEASAKTNLLDRTDKSNKQYSNPDNDPNGKWTSGDLQAKDFSKTTFFGIQSPISGELFYPDKTKHWRFKRSDIKQWLEEYGIKYSEVKLKYGEFQDLKALVIKGSKVVDDKLVTPNNIMNSARKKALSYITNNPVPRIIFLKDGYGVPRIKRYLKDVKKGMVPMTYWGDEEYEENFYLGTQSWDHTESGHSQMGINELDRIVGKGHGFDTVKPLKLIEKIIQLWCPPNGYVLDPYAGSGTTGHAVLELNHLTETNRKFILIEQGAPEKGDKYARTLTSERVKRAITGERVDKNGNISVSDQPLGGGFTFQTLTKAIDSKTILSMQRDEMIDLIVATHWDTGKRNSINLIRIDNDKLLYCVGKNENNEGYFIIWDPDNSFGALDYSTYNKIVKESKMANLKPPYHIYARYEVYQDNKNVDFYKIPDKVLAHLGLDENNDKFNEESEE